MRFRGGEFSTGTMGNFQPELTQRHARSRNSHEWQDIFSKNRCRENVHIVAHKDTRCVVDWADASSFRALVPLRRATRCGSVIARSVWNDGRQY